LGNATLGGLANKEGKKTGGDRRQFNRETMGEKKDNNSELPTGWPSGNDFEITEIARRLSAGGTWVKGTFRGFYFEALVFCGHARHKSYELESSRISKLWVQRISDLQVAAHFDRGWVRRPTDAAALIVVELLTAKLAAEIYGE
jgi:hypothetical protein